MVDWKQALQERGVQGVFEVIIGRLEQIEKAMDALALAQREQQQQQAQGVKDDGQSNATDHGLRDSAKHDPDRVDDGERGHTGDQELSGRDASTPDLDVGRQPDDGGSTGQESTVP